VISTFASYFFYNRWSEAEDKNMVLLSEKNVLAQNYSAVKNVFDKTYEDMIVIRDRNTRVFTLQSTDTTKRFAARVYWNHLSREAFLDIQSLPVPDSGKQYQLWALVGGKPVDAGVFEVSDEAGLRRMKSVFEAEAWAVTIEPAGGSIAPTLSTMCLLSKG
jgi:anti-sigma-K factor RskA